MKIVSSAFKDRYVIPSRYTCEGASKSEIEKAIHGRIIAQALLIGRYEKGKGY